ncbi:MAG: 2-oxoglutarate dehydrogenase E1 component [SAR324 cluster bacterium]|nr:2-oxoglutarate dehydrogenase E1 component [SAR324 cluster bacterium]
MRNPAELATILSSVNSEYLQDLYDDYVKSPAAFDPQWREFFESIANGDGAPRPGAGAPDSPGRLAAALSASGAAALWGDRGKQSSVFQLINNYRVFGHTQALLDPLGKPHMDRPPDLSLQNFGLTEADLDETFSTGTLVAPPTATLREIVDQVTRTYCRLVGVEYMMIRDQSQRLWLQETMEQSWNQPSFDKETKRHILTKLTHAELIEKYLQTKFVGQKRFSLEGSETLITMLEGLVDEAGEWGVEEIVLGMPHRGRLNALVNLMDKPPEFIFAEFEDIQDVQDREASGDVKYHLGFSSDRTTRGGKTVHLSLSFNPSHLEAVNPVVEGNVRAKQDLRGDTGRTQVMPVLMHGDAAFAGQGLVTETLNLSQLPGFTTGGTIHIIVNNQIGFTTHPRYSRSFLYPSDMSKILLVPVLHVNGDHPEAVLHVIKMAVAFRQKFHTDIVVDLFCYRRHGHNEMDEPKFTQPLTYGMIENHPSTLEIYSKKLIAEGTFTEDEVQRIQTDYRKSLDEALARMRKDKIRSKTETLKGTWTGLERYDPDQIAITEVNRELLQEITDCVAGFPDGFTPHRRVAKLLQTRSDMMAGETPIDWGFGELLAYGSLVKEGYRVRMTGQDVTRGTFSHRHANLVDVNNGEDYTALAHLPGAEGRFAIHDSSLSEAGVLGFEFGYSLADPLCLTIWEAQFGDFANSAQVIIDQFIATSEEKWLRMSGLVLLLPHGYEGQGPEHSSARLERYLQMCASDNIQVCYPTTPAQNFHMLRRQLHRTFRKPLIVMSPKSLLRSPLATSSIEDMIKGNFREVRFEQEKLDAGRVKRIVLCTGKVYYDIANERRKRKRDDIALVRIEQLYPFPAEEVEQVFGTYTNASEVVWAQEEPKNMGAWTFIAPYIGEVLPGHWRLRYVGRPAASSPAVGSHQIHAEETRAFVDDALS